MGKQTTTAVTVDSGATSVTKNIETSYSTLSSVYNSGVEIMKSSTFNYHSRPQTMTVFFDANTGDERTEVIYVKNASGTKVGELTLTQRAKGKSFSWNQTTPSTVAADNNSQVSNGYTNTYGANEVMFKKDVGWIKSIEPNVAVVGEGTCIITVSENTDSQRTGYVSAYTDNTSLLKVWEIKQNGKETSYYFHWARSGSNEISTRYISDKLDGDSNIFTEGFSTNYPIEDLVFTLTQTGGEEVTWVQKIGTPTDSVTLKVLDNLSEYSRTCTLVVTYGESVVGSWFLLQNGAPAKYNFNWTDANGTIIPNGIKDISWSTNTATIYFKTNIPQSEFTASGFFVMSQLPNGKPEQPNPTMTVIPGQTADSVHSLQISNISQNEYSTFICYRIVVNYIALYQSTYYYYELLQNVKPENAYFRWILPDDPSHPRTPNGETRADINLNSINVYFETSLRDIVTSSTGYQKFEIKDSRGNGYTPIIIGGGVAFYTNSGADKETNYYIVRLNYNEEFNKNTYYFQVNLVEPTQPENGG